MEERRKIRATLRRSWIGERRTFEDTLRGLGLTRREKTVLLTDTPSVRGMLRKVAHLVEWETVDSDSASASKKTQ